MLSMKMAIRSLNGRSNCRFLETSTPHLLSRFLSSRTSRADRPQPHPPTTHHKTTTPSHAPLAAVNGGGRHTKSQTLRLNNFTASGSVRPAAVLQKWVEDGHKVELSQLRFISRLLAKSRRYAHALEVLEWIEARKKFCLSAMDHGSRVDLLVKVRGLREAEEYYARLTDVASKKSAAFPLLHGYVGKQQLEKAEDFMTSLNHLGIIMDSHFYSEMMKLYVVTTQFEKVLLVIREMKRNNVTRTVLSYNLWMRACFELGGVGKAEAVYKEMVGDERVQVGWSTLATLADSYFKAGLVDKALSALENAEKKLSKSERLGYLFLITQYSRMKNKEGMLRLWKASKAVAGRITCANYVCILSCLVKFGDLLEAENVFQEWESNRGKYDIRVSNVLLGAYVRTGLLEKAESFHTRTLESGGCPNYKTWEILMEGWVKSQKMDKAVEAMKEGFAMLESCQWRPSHGVLLSIAEYFASTGNFVDANYYIRTIHKLRLTSLPLYNVFLRMYVCARRPPYEILKMMEKDKIEMDDEAYALVQAFESPLHSVV